MPMRLSPVFLQVSGAEAAFSKMPIGAPSVNSFKLRSAKDATDACSPMAESFHMPMRLSPVFLQVSGADTMSPSTRKGRPTLAKGRHTSPGQQRGVGGE